MVLFNHWTIPEFIANHLIANPHCVQSSIVRPLIFSLSMGESLPHISKFSDCWYDDLLFLNIHYLHVHF
jgi:hypothetical protein